MTLNNYLRGRHSFSYRELGSELKERFTVPPMIVLIASLLLLLLLFSFLPIFTIERTVYSNEHPIELIPRKINGLLLSKEEVQEKHGAVCVSAHPDEDSIPMVILCRGRNPESLMLEILKYDVLSTFEDYSVLDTERIELKGETVTFRRYETKECSKYEQICEEYRQECSRYEDVCRDYYTKCKAYREVCRDYSTRCLEYKEVCTETFLGFCIKKERICARQETICTDKDRICAEQETVCANRERVCAEYDQVCVKYNKICVDYKEYLLNSYSKSGIGDYSFLVVSKREDTSIAERLIDKIKTKKKEKVNLWKYLTFRG
ncbi:hypothetical protein DRN46_06820 [Thermococci archaeon]|nr:MAG: hypothetical protein DRN46_06820 [Thermococci archaeon]